MSDNSSPPIPTSSSPNSISQAIEHLLLINYEEENKKIINREWFLYARSYLQSAEILFENVATNRWLFIPAFFNLKHGIELTIKTLYKLHDINFDNKHDIRELYRKIQEKIDELNKKDLKKVATEFNFTEEKMRDISKSICSRFRELLTKYYFELPISKTFSTDSFIIHDIDNEIFRYPEANKIKILFKNTNLINKIYPADTKQMIKDIKDILIFLSLIYFTLAK